MKIKIQEDARACLVEAKKRGYEKMEAHLNAWNDEGYQSSLDFLPWGIESAKERWKLEGQEIWEYVVTQLVNNSSKCGGAAFIIVDLKKGKVSILKGKGIPVRYIELIIGLRKLNVEYVKAQFTFDIDETEDESGLFEPKDSVRTIKNNNGLTIGITEKFDCDNSDDEEPEEIYYTSDVFGKLFEVDPETLQPTIKMVRSMDITDYGDSFYSVGPDLEMQPEILNITVAPESETNVAKNLTDSFLYRLCCYREGYETYFDLSKPAEVKPRPEELENCLISVRDILSHLRSQLYNEFVLDKIVVDLEIDVEKAQIKFSTPEGAFSFKTTIPEEAMQGFEEFTIDL